MSVYRESGKPAPDPDYVDNAALYIEERILESAARMVRCRAPVRRRVLVSVVDFFNLARRLGAKVDLGPVGEYVMIHTPAGLMWIVPSVDLDEGRYVLEMRE